jgi:hypothetical protein
MSPRGAALLLAAALAAPLPAATWVYRESRGARSETHTYTLTEAAPGYRLEVLRRTPEGDIRDTLACDAELNTLAWEYDCPATSSHWGAVRRGDAIELEGSHHGRPLRRSYKIDSAPWKQAFAVDFAPFAAAGGEHAFWSVGTSGPGELKCARFKARCAGTETVRAAGADAPAVRLRVALAGWRSIFWHGDYWFRRGDWRYLRYRGSAGLLAGDIVKELVSE